MAFSSRFVHLCCGVNLRPWIAAINLRISMWYSCTFVFLAASGPRWGEDGGRILGRLWVQQEGLAGLAAARRWDRAGEFCAIVIWDIKMGGEDFDAYTWCFFLFPFCSCLSRCSWWSSFHLDIIRGIVIKSEMNKVWHRNLELESGGGHGGSTLW